MPVTQDILEMVHSVQTLMNAMRVEMIAIITLPAPIMMVPLLVPVTQDILEMVHTVKTFMNAMRVEMIAIITLPALIQMGPSLAHVTKDTLEMKGNQLIVFVN